MKRSHLSKLAGAGLLALSLAILPSTLPVTGQTTNSFNSPGFKADHNHGDTTRPNDTPTKLNKDSIDWGLLGVVGLVGLLALAANNFRRNPF